MKLFIDFDNPIPIYQEIDFESDEVPFGLSKANRNTNFVGLRCEKLEIIPHVHVTHLETKSHLGGALECLPLSLNEPLLTKIITEDDDEYENESDNMQIQFLIIKKHNPKKRNFEGINLVDQILKKYPNTFVFGINEPSFDAEDAIEMSVHKRFFNHNVHEVIVYLIEMLNLDHVMPGRYYCFLNLFRYGLTDAYPCSPVLYRIPAEMVLSDSCLFCKIIRGVIPSFKVYETNLTYAFLDINPLSEGHILVIPKFHGARLHEITDEHLADILPVARNILLNCFGDNGASIIPPYNILQNNGRLAHQEVDHVHFHIIPKRTEEEGLGIKWPSTPGNMTKLAQYAESIRAKLAQ